MMNLEWLYPFTVKRKDNVSATAIRNGAKGMVTPGVDIILENLKNYNEIFF